AETSGAGRARPRGVTIDWQPTKFDLSQQGENATLGKELLARGLPVPGVPSPPAAKPSEPEFKLPSDADVNEVMSFLERAWRRLLEMGREVQKDVERKN